MTMRPLLLFLGILAATLLSAPAVAGECLPYNKPVTLTGTVIEGVFPGLPNYESVARGDEPEDTTFLMIEGQPFCTNENGELQPAETRVEVVQLAGFHDSRLKLGEVITLSGKLDHAISGHHHAAILLLCDGAQEGDLCLR